MAFIDLLKTFDKVNRIKLLELLAADDIYLMRSLVLYMTYTTVIKFL